MKTTTKPPPAPPLCPACGQPLKLYLARRPDKPSHSWVSAACVPCNYAEDEAGKLTFYAGGLHPVRPLPI